MIEQEDVSVHSYRAVVSDSDQRLDNVSDWFHASMEAADIDVSVVCMKNEGVLKSECAGVRVRIQFTAENKSVSGIM